MTERQGRFVEACLFGEGRVRFNATRAAEAVGYRWPEKQGPRLLTFPYVNWAVETGFKIRYLIARDADGEPILRSSVHVGK